uniref:Uncharacterized protein n=1 Tax=Arundo donax TaxID=35708 RepID=A0A0A9DVF3_ARUDO
MTSHSLETIAPSLWMITVLTHIQACFSTRCVSSTFLHRIAVEGYSFSAV